MNDIPNIKSKHIISTLSIIMAVVGIFMFGVPKYRVWNRAMTGRAELAQAEYNRKIQIAEAEAHKESAVALADAEIIRAHGVAEANRIIGDSLKNNEAYLRYLYVNSLAEKDANVYYIPTEAGLPILEAGKR